MAATILLVDADLIDRADWQALLQFHGYKVVAVQDGRAALEKFPAVRPDLILIDLGLKDIPGHELGRRMQVHPRFAKTPIVFTGPYSERLRTRVGRGTESGSFNGSRSREEAFYRVQNILGGSTGLLFENGADSRFVDRDVMGSQQELKRG